MLAPATLSLFALVAAQAAPSLPARRLAGQVILMRFAGNPPQSYVEPALRRGEAAGVILFRDNATSPAASRALTARLQRAGGGDLLIAADQEGGAIRILPWAPPSRAQSEIPSTTAAYSAGRAAAAALRRNGVNLNLAPVADRPGPGTLMRTRAFGSGRFVAPAVRAYRGTGVAPTLKHFPGLGAASANTDNARVTTRPDVGPFRAGIRAGAPAVMLSHAVYPGLDRSAVASQSRRIVTGLLKGRLGFAGVAMTDSLEAYAVRSRMSMERAAVRSIRAGIDLIVTTGAGTHLRVLRALTREGRRSPAFRARLADAAERVNALRQRVGGG